MLEVTATAVLPVPPEQLWELISDTDRYPEWVQGTDAVTRTDGPTAPGSTYDEVNPVIGPWKARTHWTVVEHDAPRRQVHTSADLPLVSRLDIVMVSDPHPAGTSFALTFRAVPSHGPVGAACAGLMRPRIARDNRRTVEQLTRLFSGPAAWRLPPSL